MNRQQRASPHKDGSEAGLPPRSVPKPTLSALGDSAFLLAFNTGNGVSDCQLARLAARAISGQPPEGMVEVVPAFGSVTVFYDPLAWQGPDIFSRALLQCAEAAGEKTEWPSSRLIEIPVRYGGEFGPDLQEVADLHQL